MKKIFFSLNDFSKDSGGTIRMKGILNSIAKKEKIILLSNIIEKKDFSDNIEFIDLNIIFNKKDKRVFQLLLTILPFFIFKALYKNFFIKINKIIVENELENEKIIFFEHLDNSIGYSLKKSNIIIDYINDTHGIAVLEFAYKRTSTIKEYLVTKTKEILSKILDKKVFNSAYGIIFVSNAMKDYFEKRGLLKNKKIFIIRDGVNESLSYQKIDEKLLDDTKKELNIKNTTKIIFFAGNFKDLGGVIDLIKAYIIFESSSLYETKLLLIGDGECMNEALRLSEQSKNIHILGRRPYDKLKTYQELSNIIVCPDKAHPYSEIVPHVKYFDSLVSNKIVINGKFKSTNEINKNEQYSIDFEPSNIQDLAKKIEYCLENELNLKEKYKNNFNNILENFSYNKTTKEFNA